MGTFKPIPRLENQPFRPGYVSKRPRPKRMDVAKRRLDPEADPGPIRFGTSRPSLRSNPVIARREGRRALPEGAKRALEEGRAFGRPPAHDDDNVATLMAWGGEPA